VALRVRRGALGLVVDPQSGAYRPSEALNRHIFFSTHRRRAAQRCELLLADLGGVALYLALIAPHAPSAFSRTRLVTFAGPRLPAAMTVRLRVEGAVCLMSACDQACTADA